jgi:SAM-dependent methyltransferase
MVRMNESNFIENELLSEKIYDRLLRLEVWLKEKGLRKIPVTERRIGDYIVDLFPEYFQREYDLIGYLEDKVVADIGSGKTHKNPYSLINVATAKGKNIKFFGIDPMAGQPQKEKKDPGFVAAKINELIRKLFSLDKVFIPPRPAEKSIIGAKAESLPIADQKVDIILSEFFVTYWIRDPQQLLEIFKEFKRVLSVGGEIRLHSVTPQYEKMLFDKKNQLGVYMGENFTTANPDDRQGDSGLLILKAK